MTAIVIPFKRPEGRPSNAALQVEVRTLRDSLAVVIDERDELDAELSAWVTERIRAAAETVALARRGLMLAAAGRDPSPVLERIATTQAREALRARSARLNDEGGAA